MFYSVLYIFLLYLTKNIFNGRYCPTIKFARFGRATFSYSAVQPPFNVDFSWTLVYIRKLPFGFKVRRPGISNNPRHCPFSRYKFTHRPIHTLVEWSLGDSQSAVEPVTTRRTLYNDPTMVNYVIDNNHNEYLSDNFILLAYALYLRQQKLFLKENKVILHPYKSLLTK